MTTDELQQGDILVKNTHNKNVEYFLILTPDCDIYNNKFRNIITILPILRISEYIENVLFDGELDKLLNQFEELFISLEQHAIDRYFFYEYVLPNDPDQAFQTFIGKNAPDEFKIARRYRLGEITPTQAFLDLCKIRKASVAKRVKGCLKNLQQDFFFLNTLPTSSDFGFLVDLRRPVSISADHIVLKDVGIISGNPENTFYHLGSLPDSIRFSLSQAFASLFSRIGMPIIFERERDQIIQLFEEKFS